MKLYPEAQFVPTFKNISKISENYSLKLIAFELAKSGIENCTVFVDTNSGNYVLRIYRQGKKTEKEIKLEAHFLYYLSENQIPVAAPLPNRDGATASQLIDNTKVWFAILMPIMEGAHAKEYTHKLIAGLASYQAKMHILAMSFKQDIYQSMQLKELRESHFIGLILSRNTLDVQRKRFIERAEKYSVTLNENMPSGLCHLDYDNDNVLSIDDKVTAVLDFDDLAYAPFVQCLAYSAWDVAFANSTHAINEYLSVYERIRPLQQSERDALISIVLFRHYVVGCANLADGALDDEKFKRFLELEAELLKMIRGTN